MKLSNSLILIWGVLFLCSKNIYGQNPIWPISNTISNYDQINCSFGEVHSQFHKALDIQLVDFEDFLAVLDGNVEDNAAGGNAGQYDFFHTRHDLVDPTNFQSNLKKMRYGDYIDPLSGITNNHTFQAGDALGETVDGGHLHFEMWHRTCLTCEWFVVDPLYNTVQNYINRPPTYNDVWDPEINDIIIHPVAEPHGAESGVVFDNTTSGLNQFDGNSVRIRTTNRTNFVLPANIENETIYANGYVGVYGSVAPIVRVRDPRINPVVQFTNAGEGLGIYGCRYEIDNELKYLVEFDAIEEDCFANYRYFFHTEYNTDDSRLYGNEDYIELRRVQGSEGICEPHKEIGPNNIISNGVWNTRAEESSAKIFGITPGSYTDVPQNALYEDGKHDVDFQVYDATSGLVYAYTDITVDNFMPYLTKIEIFQGINKLYEANRTEYENSAHKNDGFVLNQIFLGFYQNSLSPLWIRVSTSEGLDHLNVKIGSTQHSMSLIDEFTWELFITTTADCPIFEFTGKDQSNNDLVSIGATLSPSTPIGIPTRRASGNGAAAWHNYPGQGYIGTDVAAFCFGLCPPPGPNLNTTSFTNECRELTNLEYIVENSVCNGSTGSIALDLPDNIYSIVWSNEVGTIFNQYENNTQIEDISSGMYCFSIRFQDCCGTYGCIEVLDDIIEIEFDIEANPSCNAANGALRAIVYTNGVESQSLTDDVEWQDGFIGSVHEDLEAGTYCAYLWKNTNCEVEFCYNLENSPENSTDIELLTVITHPSSPYCRNGEIDLTIAGMYTGLQWWSPSFPGWHGNYPHVYVLQPGTYCVEVLNNECSIQECFEVVNDECPDCVDVLQVEQLDFDCDTGLGRIRAFIGGNNWQDAFTYLWNTGATEFEIEVAEGEYSVTVTNIGNGCTYVGTGVVSRSFDFGPIIWPFFSYVWHPQCNGGLGQIWPFVTDDEDCDYLWSNGATTEGITALSVGIYCLTVTNSCGLSDDACFMLEIGPNIQLEGITSIYECNYHNGHGAINILVEGNDPFTYLWSNGATTQDISSLYEGVYTVTVTDEGGCTSSATYELVCCQIEDPIEPKNSWYADPITDVEAIIVNPPIGSSGGTVWISWEGGAGPVYYLWESNVLGFDGSDLTNLPPGDYYVTVTDGCSQGNTEFHLRDCRTYEFTVEPSIVYPCRFNGILYPGMVTFPINPAVSPPFGPVTYTSLNGQIQGPVFTNVFGANDPWCVYATDATGCTQEICLNIPWTNDAVITADWPYACAVQGFCHGEPIGPPRLDVDFDLLDPGDEGYHQDYPCRARLICPFDPGYEIVDPFVVDGVLECFEHLQFIDQAQENCETRCQCSFPMILGAPYTTIYQTRPCCNPAGGSVEQLVLTGQDINNPCEAFYYCPFEDGYWIIQGEFFAETCSPGENPGECIVLTTCLYPELVLHGGGSPHMTWVQIIDCPDEPILCRTSPNVQNTEDVIYRSQQISNSSQAYVYPNPFMDYLQIDISNRNKTSVMIELISIDGLLLLHDDITIDDISKTISLDCRLFPAGAYILRLTFTDGTIQFKKLVKAG